MSFNIKVWSLLWKHFLGNQFIFLYTLKLKLLLLLNTNLGLSRIHSVLSPPLLLVTFLCRLSNIFIHWTSPSLTFMMTTVKVCLFFFAMDFKAKVSRCYIILNSTTLDQEGCGVRRGGGSVRYFPLGIPHNLVPSSFQFIAWNNNLLSLSLQCFTGNFSDFFFFFP